MPAVSVLSSQTYVDTPVMFLHTARCVMGLIKGGGEGME